MTRVLTALALAIGIAAAPAGAQPAPQPTERLFLDAGAKEQAVRAALANPDAPATVLKAVRTVVADYEAIVRRFPASAYCDDALWRAGQLALEAHAKFGDADDRTAGLRLLRALVSEYPSSRFVSQARALLGAPAPRAAAARPAAPPARPPARSAAAGDQPVKTTGTTRAAPARVTTIKDIRRVVLPDAVRIVIELDGEVTAFHDERLANPLRVFVDLAATRASAELVDRTIRFESDADVVRQVRLGRHPNTTTRVVVDASGISSYSVYPLYSPYRLVIDFIREPAPEAAAAPRRAAAPPPAAPLPAATLPPVAASPPAPAPVPPAAVAPARVEPLEARRVPAPAVVSMPRGAPILPPVVREAAALPVLAAKAIKTRPVALVVPRVPRPLPPVLAAANPPAPAGSKPAAATARAAGTKPLESSPSSPAAGIAPVPPPASGFSIARQLGLGVSRIVIDPGHGGHDPGGVTRGTTEAEIVLDVALRLEKLLAAAPGVEVILTRRTDEFLPLQERTAIANRAGADLFLSIHANASANTRAAGVETYFLNFATNASAAAIAARENANSGQALGALPDFVKLIALNTKMDESRDFATFVQRSMVAGLAPANRELKDLGVKQAPFVVLIGASMPSVLAEISFLTNAQEARLLRTGGYRQKIAEALFDAIRKYQSSLAADGRVASQQP